MERQACVNAAKVQTIVSNGGFHGFQVDAGAEGVVQSELGVSFAGCNDISRELEGCSSDEILVNGRYSYG